MSGLYFEEFNVQSSTIVRLVHIFNVSSRTCHSSFDSSFSCTIDWCFTNPYISKGGRPVSRKAFPFAPTGTLFSSNTSTFNQPEISAKTMKKRSYPRGSFTSVLVLFLTHCLRVSGVFQFGAPRVSTVRHPHYYPRSLI